jgi:hypothetical protein
MFLAGILISTVSKRERQVKQPLQTFLKNTSLSNEEKVKNVVGRTVS